MRKTGRCQFTASCSAGLLDATEIPHKLKHGCNFPRNALQIKTGRLKGWMQGLGPTLTQFCRGDERLANSSADLAPGTTMSVKVGSGAATVRKSSRGFFGDSAHFQNMVPVRA